MANICNVCGDTGYSDFLVSCRHCGEAAEHVYCMLQSFDIHPETGWACKECTSNSQSCKQEDALELVSGTQYQACAQTSKHQAEFLESFTPRKKLVVELSAVDLNSAEQLYESAERAAIESPPSIKNVAITLSTVHNVDTPNSFTGVPSLQMSKPHTNAMVLSPKNRISSELQDTLPSFLIDSMPDTVSVAARVQKYGKDKHENVGNPSTSGKLADLNVATEACNSARVSPELSMNEHKDIWNDNPNIIHKDIVENDLFKSHPPSKMSTESCKNTMSNMDTQNFSSQCENLTEQENLLIKHGSERKHDCLELEVQKTAVMESTDKTSKICEDILEDHLHGTIKETFNNDKERADYEKDVTQCDASFQEKVHKVIEACVEVRSNNEINLCATSYDAVGTILDLHDDDASDEAVEIKEVTAVGPRGASTSCNIDDEVKIEREISHSVLNCTKTPLQRDSIDENENSNSSEGVSMFTTSPILCPRSTTLWRGSFKVFVSGKQPKTFKYHGLRAHPSKTAHAKVLELTRSFASVLSLDQVFRSDMWPSRFVKCPPTEDSIGLYFFAAPDERIKKAYDMQLTFLNKLDCGLRMDLTSAQLLIFSSLILPKASQKFQGSYYMWGAFRPKDNNVISDHSDPSRSRNVKNTSEGLNKVELDNIGHGPIHTSRQKIDNGKESAGFDGENLSKKIYFYSRRKFHSKGPKKDLGIKSYLNGNDVAKVKRNKSIDRDDKHRSINRDENLSRNVLGIRKTHSSTKQFSCCKSQKHKKHGSRQFRDRSSSISSRSIGRDNRSRDKYGSSSYLGHSTSSCLDNALLFDVPENIYTPFHRNKNTLDKECEHVNVQLDIENKTRIHEDCDSSLTQMDTQLKEMQLEKCSGTMLPTACDKHTSSYVSNVGSVALSSLQEEDNEDNNCLPLFPLQEEYLGMTKGAMINAGDIDLNLGLGFSSLRKITHADIQCMEGDVCS